MNPFFLGPDSKVNKDVQAPRDERMVQDMIQSLPSTSLALRLGRLLIRMGTKLAHEDQLQYPSKNVAA